MNNALDPNSMSAHDRIAEVSELLAGGILRHRLRSRYERRKSRDRRELSLADRTEQSAHVAEPTETEDTPWIKAC